MPSPPFSLFYNHLIKCRVNNQPPRLQIPPLRTELPFSKKWSSLSSIAVLIQFRGSRVSGLARALPFFLKERRRLFRMPWDWSLTVPSRNLQSRPFRMALAYENSQGKEKVKWWLFFSGNKIYSKKKTRWHYLNGQSRNKAMSRREIQTKYQSKMSHWWSLALSSL